MKVALVVIDGQNDFVRGSSPYACQMLDQNLIMKIGGLIKFCREKQIPVIYTQHSIKPDKSNAENGEPDDIRACITGTKGWDIIESLKPDKGEDVIQKDRFDAFFNSSLENLLKRLKVNTLIISGVYTNNCVRATAEGAYCRGYKIILVSDCCGCSSFVEGKTAEEVNDFTLNELKERTYGTRVVSLNDLKEML